MKKPRKKSPLVTRGALPDFTPRPNASYETASPNAERLYFAGLRGTARLMPNPRLYVDKFVRRTKFEKVARGIVPKDNIAVSVQCRVELKALSCRMAHDRHAVTRHSKDISRSVGGDNFSRAVGGECVRWQHIEVDLVLDAIAD